MKKAMELLEKYVNHPSGTYDIEDVTALGEIIAADLRALGMRVTLLPGKQMGPVIVGEYGRGENRLLLIGHYDTVFPHDECQKFQLEGDIARGSGVSDMKGGLVIMQRALFSCLADIDPEKTTVTALINPDEEIGSAESGEHILEYAKKSKAVLSFEPTREGGGLVCERKGVTSFRLETTGIRGHAGANYLSCASAIQALARLIGRVYTLRDDAREISINIGEIGGGNAENVVADFAFARGEFRYFEQKYQREIMDAIQEIVSQPDIPGTGARVTFGATHPALGMRPENRALADRAISIAQELGRSLTIERTGGAGDIAIVGLSGTPVLDGLGLEGKNMHTTQEIGYIKSMPFSIELTTRLIKSLLAEWQ